MNFAFGDICIVDFDPSVGHEYRKTRPAIVIQESSITKKSPILVVLPISTKVDGMQVDNILIEKDEKNNLNADSAIKVQHITGCDLSRIRGYLGSANSPVIRQVRGYLRRHFGL